jgi:hypothetical protein
MRRGLARRSVRSRGRRTLGPPRLRAAAGLAHAMAGVHYTDKGPFGGVNGRQPDGVQLHTSEVMTSQAVAAVPQGGGIRVHSIQ